MQSLIFLIIFFLIGCTTINNSINEPILEVNKNYHGKEIYLKNGEIFEIQLEENPSTGYEWHFFQLDKALLDIISIKKQPKSKFIGAPVISIWKIKALKSGESKIIMKYYRDWEGIEKAVDNFEVKIIISDK